MQYVSCRENIFWLMTAMMLPSLQSEIVGLMIYISMPLCFNDNGNHVQVIGIAVGNVFSDFLHHGHTDFGEALSEME